MIDTAREGGTSRVSLIVVNYNGEKYLRECLPLLVDDRDAPLEVLVVDNASTDGSRAVLAELAARHPLLTILHSDANLGYAGGVNFALPHARGVYVGALNMDIAVEPGWLAPLVEFLEKTPKAGAVSPLILLADRDEVNAAGQDIHLSGLGFNRGHGARPARFAGAPARVGGIHGGAFVIRRELLARLGGMDTTGFLYHEDVNLSWLLRLAGFELYCEPKSVVRHDYYLSMYASKFHLLERNRLALLLSFPEWTTLAALAPVLLGTESLLWCYCLIKGRAFLRAKGTSYRWVAERWSRIQERRELARSVRAVSDWDVLRGLDWGYSWEQALHLLRDRRPPRHDNLHTG